MGMTIDESITELEKARDSIEPCLFMDEAIDQSMKTAISTMHKYQKMQADYENRLKADMVAMLTEIQLEIEETVKEEELIDKNWANGLHYSEKIIQQKIDTLKAESEED